MSNQYCLYCITEDLSKSVWANALPTVCPTNAGHTINTNSVYLSQVANPYYRSGFLGKTAGSTSFTTVAQITWPGVDLSGNIIKIEILSVGAATVSAYNMRVVNNTNSLVLGTVNLGVQTVYTLNDLGTLSNLPTTKTILLVQANRTGTGSATIADVVIYTDKTT